MKKYLLLLPLFIGLLVLLLILSRNAYVDALLRPASSFPLRIKWQTDLGYSTYERLVYQAGSVFLPANNRITSYWHGIDATTGQVIWTQKVRGDNFLRCLTAEYLVVSGSWSIVTLKANTGEIIWQGERAQAASCSHESVFFSGVLRDTIRAFGLSTGQQLWSGTEPGKSFGGLIYNPETEEILAQESLGSGNFYVIDPQTGRLKHSFSKAVFLVPQNGGSLGLGPMYLIDRGELFLGGTVQDAQSGDVIHKEERYSATYPTVTTDTMYLSAHSEGIVTFDRANYNVKWVYQPQPSDPLNPLAPIAILDGVGYTIFLDATLRAFDLETGQELGYWQPETNDLWWWPICSFPPILCDESARAGVTASDDTLFVSFGDGKLYAFSQ